MAMSGEIKAFLWPFYKSKDPQSLRDLGFVLHLPEGMRHLLILPASPEEEKHKEVDVSLIPSVTAEQRDESVRETKRARRKRTVDDDDSWMPEGWWKKVNTRPNRGKFPGYGDKMYYAPGVPTAFRSKASAQKYIENHGIASTGCSTNTSNQPENGVALPPQTDAGC
ncbi:hypothetical protein ACS0TY_035439 [Phlomoides rotata]